MKFLFSSFIIIGIIVLHWGGSAYRRLAEQKT
jgi:hypothetical protein